MTHFIGMFFTQNVGQLSDEVLFYSLHPSVVYVLRDGTIHINGVKVSFKSKPRFITGDIPLITKVSYFGRNKSISGIPTYKRVVLKGVYPNIDAILTADGRGVVEFQFVVHPGGDPEDIRVNTDGDVVQRGEGIYIVKGGREVVRISNLKAYQGAEEVEVRVDVKGKEVKFIVDDWDREHTLVIDPILTAILSSSGGDIAVDVKVDPSGYVFVAGYTDSSMSFAPFRTVFGAVNEGFKDVFISKLSPDLSTHISTAILASTYDDIPGAIDIDISGNIYVAGKTDYYLDFSSSRVVFGTTGGSEAFVSKLSNDLTTHFATVILASSGSDKATSIKIGASGEVYVAGYTENSSDFMPGRNVFGSTGYADAFVSKFTPDLSTPLSTAIIASSKPDFAYSLTIDDSGNVFLAGWTYNYADFAPSRTIFGTVSSGYTDAFITKLSSDLSTHISTCILTSSSFDGANVVLWDDSGYVFVAGFTAKPSDFSISRNIFGSSGGYGAFISKLSDNLATHVSTAILTSSSHDYAYSLTLDSSGNIFIVGETYNSSDFAPNRNIYGHPGGNDAFVSKLSGDLMTHLRTAILTSSYNDRATSIIMGLGGDVFVVGETFNALDFSFSRRIYGDTSPPGYSSVFVSKIPNTLNIITFKDTSSFSVKMISRELKIVLYKSTYLGFDIYGLSGRIIKRVSVGYVPAGEYSYSLNLPRGIYTIRVRVGNEIVRLKTVF